MGNRDNSEFSDGERLDRLAFGYAGSAAVAGLRTSTGNCAPLILTRVLETNGRYVKKLPRSGKRIHLRVNKRQCDRSFGKARADGNLFPFRQCPRAANRGPSATHEKAAYRRRTRPVYGREPSRGTSLA